VNCVVGPTVQSLWTQASMFQYTWSVPQMHDASVVEHEPDQAFRQSVRHWGMLWRG
jgi:hypothetical protein